MFPKLILNLFVIVILLSTHISFAQFISKNSKQILIKGVVKDKFDGTPLEATIEFEDVQGKSFKIKSNSLTGKYEQILEAGQNYKAKLKSDYIFPTEINFKTDTTDNYKEQHLDFLVTKLEKNREVACFQLFQTNSSELTDNFKQEIDKLNLNMRFNRNIKVALIVTGDDAISNFTKISIKTKSKKKIQDTTFLDKDYANFVSQRFQKLSSEVKKLLLYPERVEFEKREVIPNNTLNSSCDVILKIIDFKELFDN